MIFIDSGAFLARYIERDQYHKDAIDKWQLLENERRQCVTSNFVLDETITLLARRITYEFAAGRPRSLYGSQSLLIHRPDEDDERTALLLFEKYADHKASFTDCVSFVLMDKFSIKNAFTFDYHFSIAGFEIEPESSISK